MSVTGIPHTPRKGWQTRWVIQAGGLLLRFPEISIIGICGILLCAMVYTGSRSVFADWGYIGIVLSNMITSIPAMLVPVLICAGLGILEGFGIAHRSDIIKSLCVFFIVVLLFNFMVLFTMCFMIFVMNFGETLEFAEIIVDNVLPAGIELIPWVFLFTLLTNVVWVVLITQMPMSYDDLSHTGLLIVKKCHWPGFVISIVQINTFVLVRFCPFWIAIPVMIFVITWLYVAAREMFGGISSNRRVFNTAGSLSLQKIASS